MSGADFGSGLRFKMLGVGGSVARARAAKVSIMRFTQSSCTAVSTDCWSSLATAEMKVRITAVILTEIWNYSKFSLMFRACEMVNHLKKLLDSIIDSSSPHDSFHNGSEIVVHQDDG